MVVAVAVLENQQALDMVLEAVQEMEAKAAAVAEHLTEAHRQAVQAEKTAQTTVLMETRLLILRQPLVAQMVGQAVNIQAVAVVQAQVVEVMAEMAVLGQSSSNIGLCNYGSFCRIRWKINRIACNCVG